MSTRERHLTAPLAMAVLVIGLAAPSTHAAPAAGATAGAHPPVNSARLSAAPGKPVAPIAIGYELSAQPTLGVPFTVRISARGGDGITDLALTVRAGPGLEAGTPDATSTTGDGAARTWSVAATAFADGTLYLNLLVQGTAGAEHPARNLMIPIRVGAQPATDHAALPPQSTLGSATQHFIVLPATRGR
jgi:hypothetical protein